jgi:SAM-dependent methyltransferase
VTETAFEGWDFSVFQGRFDDPGPGWDLRGLIRAQMRESMLDMGTGGGEFLRTLAPLPPVTKATEGWAPNVPVAKRNLEPLGIEVADTSAEPMRLPFPGASFDLVVSRHEEYDPAEVGRVLKPGGVFITQQVGGRDLAEINEALQGPPHQYRSYDLAFARDDLAQAGFEILDAREERYPATFADLGALVLMLRITPWHVPGFTAEKYGDRLRELPMPFRVTCHRFLLVSRWRAEPR